ncbi:MAG: DUF4199 domain-containing protein [Pseudomonadota bacterium]
MLTNILKSGLVAGLIAGVGLSLTIAVAGDSIGHGYLGMAVGYAIMLVALSLVFLAIKRERDVAGGGVIRFWPAFAMGLAISAIASVVYVIAWETAQATLIHGDFAKSYGDAIISEQRAAGASAAELAKTMREMAEFTTQYHDPLFRWPMTFMEIFPVGVLVSLIAAALLRNPRFMPARG